MSEQAQRKVSLEVKAGLYVLRYVGSADPRTAPLAFVRISRTDSGRMTMVDAPGVAPGELSGPGAALVLAVQSPGSIDVGIQPIADSTNLDARFSLDLLATGVEAATKPGTSGNSRSAPATRSERSLAAPETRLNVEILAHVARRGDIQPDPEGWIAGPKSPSAIEGLEIRAHGADVAVAAQYRNLLEAQNWSAWLTPGSFIGTRQRACPLTGLRLKLVGSDAPRYEIAGEALFLGSPKQIQRGNEVELSAAAGTDPLVGLKLAIIESAAARVSNSGRDQEAPTSRPPRVRVFRQSN